MLRAHPKYILLKTKNPNKTTATKPYQNYKEKVNNFKKIPIKTQPCTIHTPATYSLLLV